MRPSVEFVETERFVNSFVPSSLFRNEREREMRRGRDDGVQFNVLQASMRVLTDRIPYETQQPKII